MSFLNLRAPDLARQSFRRRGLQGQAKEGAHQVGRLGLGPVGHHLDLVRDPFAFRVRNPPPGIGRFHGQFGAQDFGARGQEREAGYVRGPEAREVASREMRGGLGAFQDDEYLFRLDFNIPAGQDRFDCLANPRNQRQ